MFGPRINKAYRKIRLEKSSTDGYNTLLMNYAGTSFQDYKLYLRIEVGLDGDDIQLKTN